MTDSNNSEPPIDTPRKRRFTPLKFTLFLAYIVLLLYMIIPGFLWSPVYTGIVVFPTVYDATAYATSMKGCTLQPEDHFFDNKNGDKLHGWLFKKPGASKVVLVHHGNAGNISTRYMLANELNNCGASAFIYDYRGYGRSTGVPNVAALLEDGQAANEYLKTKLQYQPAQIVHYGESIGSGVATEVAASNPSGGLILSSAVGSLPRVGKNVFAFLRPYPDFLFPQPQLQNVERIKDVHVPVLLFHGIKDRIVSYHDSEAIYANATGNKKLVLLKVSDHNCVTGEDFNTFDKEIKSFLSI